MFSLGETIKFDIKTRKYNMAPKKQVIVLKQKRKNLNPKIQFNIFLSEPCQFTLNFRLIKSPISWFILSFLGFPGTKPPELPSSREPNLKPFVSRLLRSLKEKPLFFFKFPVLSLASFYSTEQKEQRKEASGQNEAINASHSLGPQYFIFFSTSSSFILPQPFSFPYLDLV